MTEHARPVAPRDEASYPDEDLKATQVNGQWQYAHKDGSPYR